MKTSKISNISGSSIATPEKYARDVDTDLENLFLFLKGRVRLGSAGSGARGENISGEYEQFTTPAIANTEFSVFHSIGSIPVGWLEVQRSAPVVLATGTSSWTSSNAYFSCNSGSVAYTIFLLK